MEEEKKVDQPNMVESAKVQADRLEILNKELSLKIARLEEIKAFETLGGRSVGKEQEVKPVEVSPKDYAAAVLAGKVPLK